MKFGACNVDLPPKATLQGTTKDSHNLFPATLSNMKYPNTTHKHAKWSYDLLYTVLSMCYIMLVHSIAHAKRCVAI